MRVKIQTFYQIYTFYVIKITTGVDSLATTFGSPPFQTKHFQPFFIHFYLFLSKFTKIVFSIKPRKNRPSHPKIALFFSIITQKTAVFLKKSTIFSPSCRKNTLFVYPSKRKFFTFAASLFSSIITTHVFNPPIQDGRCCHQPLGH